MPKFAANLTMMFNEVPFLDRFEAAAKAGFKYVEFLWPYDYPTQELKAILDKHGLKVVLFNTPAGDVNKGEWGVSAIPGREADSHRDIDLALEYALALGCPNVHIMSAVVPEGARREALSPEVKPDYLLKSQFDTLEVVELVDRDNVFVQLDYFHAQNVDGNLARLTDKLNGKFAHVQIASVPDRHEPDEGEINYQYIFDKLDTIGYDGYVGCEYKPRGETTAGLDWFQKYK